MKQVDVKYMSCPIRNVIDRFGDKWSLLVLYTLHTKGTLRFSQIYAEMTDVSQKMLSSTLKDLERDNLVSRKAYAEIPPRVEYSLTALGESLMPALEPLIDWASTHFQDVTGGKILV
jgi:DNA-binding HxlR family transcriptional regulator